jgi:hypothetical protein
MLPCSSLSLSLRFVSCFKPHFTVPPRYVLNRLAHLCLVYVLLLSDVRDTVKGTECLQTKAANLYTIITLRTIKQYITGVYCGLYKVHLCFLLYYIYHFPR